MATGQVLFQRFYYSKSFVKHGMEVNSVYSVKMFSSVILCCHVLSTYIVDFKKRLCRTAIRMSVNRVSSREDVHVFY